MGTPLPINEIQAKNIISAIYKLITSTFKHNTNAELQNTLDTGILNYLDHPITPSGLINLRETLQNYQKGLTTYQIALHGAAESLVLVVKTMIADNTIGHLSFNQKSITQTLGGNDIGPAVNIYLNKCNLTEGIFIVGGSVFSSFDPYNLGIALSNMNGLNSITGHLLALKQCGSLRHSQEIIYATTINAAGANGTAEETGCIELTGALCQSVFNEIS